ncbi:MAG: hypothetical protein ACFFAS_09945 [Promethearchaeota archaeon]
MKFKIACDEDFLNMGNQYFHFRIKETNSPEYPYVITDESNIGPKDVSIVISDSKEYIKIDRFQYDSLGFEQCKNLKFENSKVKYLNLDECSECVVHNVDIENRLNLANCNKIVLHDINTKRYVNSSSKNTTLIHCNIKKDKIKQIQFAQI